MPVWGRELETVCWLGALAALYVLTPRGVQAPTRPQRLQLSADAEWIALLAILALAVGLRAYQLTDVPPAVLNDETMFVYEITWRPEYPDPYALSLIRHWPGTWFPYLFGIGWNGFPGLSSFLHWLPMLAGPSLWNLRMGSVVVGLASIGVLYVWARHWWGNAVAVLAALALTCNIEHVSWSRLAMNNIDTALLSSCALGALAWVLETHSERAWVALGLALGFGFHTYLGTKLNVIVVIAILALLWVTRLTTFTRRDVRGMGLGALALVLTVAPLIPDIAGNFRVWCSYHSGRIDLHTLPAALWRCDWGAAAAYLRWTWGESAGLYRATPVMITLCWIGLGVALWHWRDVRCFATAFWLISTMLVGSLGIGWRNARLVNAQPAMAVMPALLVAFVALRLPRRLRIVAGAVGAVLLFVVVREAWSALYTTRATESHNVTYELCHAILPAWNRNVPVYVAGTDEVQPEWALRKCIVPEDSSRRIVPVVSLDEITDPNALVIVYANRLDVLTGLLARDAQLVATPHYGEGRLVFYTLAHARY